MILGGRLHCGSGTIEPEPFPTQEQRNKKHRNSLESLNCFRVLD